MAGGREPGRAAAIPGSVSVSSRLLRLEARLARAERQLRAALALRGRLQALERRLERGGRRGASGPRGPARLRAPWAPFGERERRALPGWRRALRRAPRRSPRGALLPREDSIIHVKQEEELCAADQEEVEATGALEEPCPEPAFYEPETSGRIKRGTEAYARELPGAEGEDVPGDPDTEFQTCATDVMSWIKQEEEPRCPERQDLKKEEICTYPRTVHGENMKKDSPADRFGSTACDSGVLGRPGEKFCKDPTPGVTWDSQWNSEMMGTNTTRNGFGDDARYNQAFGEHLDFFSAQESVGKRPCAYSKCERDSSQQEPLPAPRGDREETFPGPVCEKRLGERMLQQQPSAPGEKRAGQRAPVVGAPLTAHGQKAADGTSICAEDHPAVGHREKLPTEKNIPSPCGDDPRDVSEAPKGGLAGQQQSQGRGKSYICNDCGKSFVCHSWLVRHQMTHTGERPYKCSECDKSYRRKDYLLNHLRRHSGEGLFQCHLCRKRFVLRRSLVKHQESHVQETQRTVGAWPCAEIRESVVHSR